MRFLVMSREGDGAGVAQRLVHEGNEVALWIQDKRYDQVGHGIVDRVDAWERAIKGADVILCDCVGFGHHEEQIRSTNKPYIGFSAVLDRIEKDRRAGMAMFERAGLAIPETHPYDSPMEAEKIPGEAGWGSGWVIKDDSVKVSDTKVVKDERLWKSSTGRLREGSRGILQRVVDGIEVSTEGWFNGSQWVMPFNHTFEEKRMMSGGIGCNTGCQGNVVFNAGRGNRLTKATIEPMGDLLRMIGYHGPFDVNAIVTPDGAYALEATARLGFDAIEALLEGLEEPAADMFAGVATGSAGSMLLTTDTMIAVRASMPPYPFRAPDSTSAGEPVLGIEEWLDHLFLTDLYLDDEGYKTAAADGVLFKATATGTVDRERVAVMTGRQYKPDYVYQARRKVYRTLSRIQADGLQYRDDIGERVNKDVDQLKKWGWLPEDF